MKISKIIPGLIAVGCLYLWAAGAARAADPLTLTITATNVTGYAVPNDFSGLSFETYDVSYGAHWVIGNEFSPTNSQMLTLFENMGVHHLRIGGGTTDNTNATHLTDSDIDNLFQFAQAADVNVIFSLQLMDGNANTDAVTAAYVWQNYAPELDYFDIGNEPDGGESSHWGTYANYESTWNSFYGTISAAVPGALFAGPDTCCDDSWDSSFANDEKSRVKLFITHDYFGGQAQNLTAEEDISNMLSMTFMDNAYNNELNGMSTVVSDGYPLRITETDDCTGGLPNASDSFASALWALDLLHWWAEAGCAGINFHNNEWLRTDTVFQGGHYGPFMVHPKGYALKAWDLGGHGYVMPMTISNPNNANDTAYAIGGGQDVYLTIVNRHPVPQGSIAACTVIPNGFQSASVSAIYLTCSTTNLEQTNGVTLGGSGGVITNNAQWQGLWTVLTPATNGQALVNVPPSQAAVVHIHAGCAYQGPIQINSKGTLEMFTVGGNGYVWHNWQSALGSDTTNWSGWHDLGSLGSGVDAVGTPTVAKNLDGTLEVFVPGSDGNVYDDAQTSPSGGWSGWNNIGGPGATDLQIAMNPDGSLNLFGIGTNGDVWYDSETAPGVGSTGWNDLSGVNIQPGFTVGQNQNGTLEIFGVDSSGTLWYRQQNSNWGTWGNWTSLSGATVDPYLQVGRNMYGNLYVFGIDTSTTNLDYIWQTTPGGSWGSWNTSDLSGLAVEPGFVVAQNGNGRFVVASLGPDGAVHMDWQTLSWTWSGWGNFGGSGIGSQLMVGNTFNGSLQVFAVDTVSDHFWSTWQLTPAGSWSSWEDFSAPTCWHLFDNPGNGNGFTTAFGACSWGAYRLDVFGIKSDDVTIYHNWLSDGDANGWQSTWEQHPLPVAAAGAPSASANTGASDREDLYFIGIDGNLYHQYYSGGSWSSWENIGMPSGTMLMGSPAATSWGPQRYDVYVRATNNTIYHIFKTSDSGSWSGWQNQGGSVTNDVGSCAWGTNRLDGFALGTSTGSLLHQYWDGAWHPTETTWAQDLPETNSLNAIGATSWAVGRMDLFADTGSTIGHIWYVNGGWNGNWTETHTPPAAPASAPSAACWETGRFDMFVLGADGKCYRTRYGQ